MKLSSVFDYSKVTFNKENEVILMTSLKAPKVKVESERAPLNLSLAIDVSGSMSGTKLETVKKSVLKLIEQLSERDSVGIVTFGSYVQEIYALSKMTQSNKASLTDQVMRLMTMGCTNMSGGMLKSFEQLKRSELDKKSVHRLIVFTDGCANEGLRTQDEFNEMVKNQVKDNPITVSCFGFGKDHDSEMLSSIADTGKGNFYFINSVEDIAKTFARELGGLLTCYAQNISIYLDIAEKHGEFVEVVNDLTCEATDKQRVKITLDDIYSEESKHILVKVKLKKASKAVTQRASSIVDTLITYNDMTESGKFKEMRSKSKINFVKVGEEDKEQALEVLEQLAIIGLSKAHDQAKQYADQHRFDQAQQVYVDSWKITSELKARGSTLSDTIGASITTATNNLNATSYTSAHGHSLKNASRGFKYMRAVDATTSMLYANSVQSDLMDSFSSPGDSSGTITINTVDTVTGDSIIDSISGNIKVNNTTLAGSTDLANGTTIGHPFQGNIHIDVTPNPRLADAEVKKRDGLNKRRTA